MQPIIYLPGTTVNNKFIRYTDCANSMGDLIRGDNRYSIDYTVDGRKWLYYSPEGDTPKPVTPTEFCSLIEEKGELRCGNNGNDSGTLSTHDARVLLYTEALYYALQDS